MRQQKRVLNPPYQLLAWLSSGRHINHTIQCTIQMATPREIGPCPLFSPQPFSLKLIADFENINMTQAMPTSKSGYHLPFTIGKSKFFSNLIIMTAAFSYVDIPFVEMLGSCVRVVCACSAVLLDSVCENCRHSFCSWHIECHTRDMGYRIQHLLWHGIVVGHCHWLR